MIAPYWLTPEFAAFREAIRAEPENDLPRLVLADWLEKRGGAEVECGRCGNTMPDGRKVKTGWVGIEATPRNRCPICRGPGVWRRGVHFDHEMRCPTCSTKNSVTWVPGEKDVFVSKCPHCTDGRVSDGAAARAEFIRVQCELAGMSEGCSQGWNPASGTGDRECSCRWHALRRRQMVLVKLVPSCPLPCERSRGFISHVRGSLSRLRAHLPAILLREPLVCPRISWGPCKRCGGESRTVGRTTVVVSCRDCAPTGSVGRVTGVDVTDTMLHVTRNADGSDAWIIQFSNRLEMNFAPGLIGLHPTELAAKHALAVAIWTEAMLAAGLAATVPKVSVV